MASAGDRYDAIGRTYSSTRQEDPRIAGQIHAAVGDGRVLNVGAGTGSYEPPGRTIAAVEPSAQMIGQRSADRAPAVQARAESLPFADGSFDVAMAVLTIHHWTDPAAGLDELARVAGRQVVFFFESSVAHRFWAIDYFPAARDLPTETDTPGEAFVREHLDVVEVQTVPVPKDCRDGFGTAFWARPEAYADPRVQAGMSWLALLPESQRRSGGERLLADLASGEWDRRHGHLRERGSFDGGYRIAVAGGER